MVRIHAQDPTETGKIGILLSRQLSYNISETIDLSQCDRKGELYVYLARLHSLYR